MGAVGTISVQVWVERDPRPVSTEQQAVDCFQIRDNDIDLNVWNEAKGSDDDACVDLRVPSAIVLRRRAKALGGAGRPSGTGHGTDYPTEAFPVPGGAGPLARRTSASL